MAADIADAVVARLVPPSSGGRQAVSVPRAAATADAGVAAAGWSRREWAMGIVTSGTQLAAPR